jgi:predicted nucleotidyltransferase
VGTEQSPPLRELGELQKEEDAAMSLSENLKNQIVQNLKVIDPDQVILFGSHAWGDPTGESDIDLYVVTKDDFIPVNWRQKNLIYLKVAKSLENIMRSHPTDLIVHTRRMHRRFMELNSSFSREIRSKGLKLYESGQS